MTSLDQQIWIPTITTILIFIVGYFLSSLNDWRRDRNQKIKAIDSMIGELKEFVRFVNDVCPKPIVRVVGTGVTYNGLQLQIASFNSMVYSKTFHDLDVETQVKISNYYEEIKITNALDENILQYMIMSNPPPPSFITTMQAFGTSIEDRLNKHHDEALDLIKHLKKIKPSPIVNKYPIEE